jgi:hypothetical protein
VLLEEVDGVLTTPLGGKNFEIDRENREKKLEIDYENLPV